MDLPDRLRELAERLPSGGSVTLTRDALLELAAGGDGRTAHNASQADLTVAELAARFHRAASTVRQWCERGRFDAAYKLNGRDWRVPPAAVEAFLAAQRGEGRTAQLGAWRAMRGTLRTMS